MRAGQRSRDEENKNLLKRILFCREKIKPSVTHIHRSTNQTKILSNFKTTLSLKLLTTDLSTIYFQVYAPRLHFNIWRQKLKKFLEKLENFSSNGWRQRYMLIEKKS